MKNNLTHREIFIKETLCRFRENYKIIEEIDRLESRKKYFTGYYTYHEPNDIETCYNNFVDDYNNICDNEIKRILNLKFTNIESYQKYNEIIDKIRKMKIKTVEILRVSLPDINIVVGISADDSDIKDTLTAIVNQYRGHLYPAVINKQIVLLEKLAFETLTGIFDSAKSSQNANPSVNLSIIKQFLGKINEEINKIQVSAT